VVTLVAGGRGDDCDRLARARVAEATGAWISIGFLALLGVANVAAVLRTPRGEVVRPRASAAASSRASPRRAIPVLIAAVGAAFAISFDTISQAVLFSLTGSHLAGGSSPSRSGSSSPRAWRRPMR
jgi:high-affinity nickel-transport protein